ncbi:MAG: NAD(P)/FAD-dependent oxidoreductase [Chloroflexi bacterium]|nr:MAG: NAD(P)/FAD-dependent oxidoreductase [Chloroflexota bacterium]
MARALVLGAGFGGIAAAVALRDQLDRSDEVILVDRRDEFVMGTRKTWHLIGASPLAEGARPLSRLAGRGIRVIRGEVRALELGSRAVMVDDDRFEADAVVIALGAMHEPSAVPGLVEYAWSAWSLEDLPAATQAIQDFPGGRVVIGIFGSPYTCPPAPFELALLLRDHFVARGIDAQVSVFGPAPIVLPVLGAAGCALLDGRLDERGVPYLAGRQARAVTDGAVRFAESEQIGFDLLLAVPPHRAPAVLVESGLAKPGSWVGVDRATLETGHPGIYAIGDCTGIPLANGLPLPKAGLFAEREGRAVASRIAATFRGEEPHTTFDGTGACFVEMGGGEASTIRGDFYADPPAIELTMPSQAQREEKVRFETERLQRWFGG